MDGEILDVVTDWVTRPVSDGVAGLYDLADDEFSGAVTDGTAWAFVLNGRVVGVFDGDVEDFEDASLTAYVAPDVSLPLLYAMQAGGGETRGEYYSQKTPLTDVDETLSSGNFVGYVELSENVLSGDYYVVYYGGRSLPVAYIGNSERLVVGDEAFDRAADEVGIYRVVDAPVSVVDLPDRPEPEPSTATTDAAGVVATSGGDDVTIDAGGESGDDADGEAGPDDVDARDESGDSGVVAAGVESGTTDGVDAGADVEDGTADVLGTTEATAGSAASTGDGTDAAWNHEAGSTGGDVERTDEPDVVNESESNAHPEPTVDGETAADRDGETAADRDGATEVPSDAPTAGPDDVTGDRLRQELAAARAAKAEAESARERAEAERDELQAEVDRLQRRVDELQAELASIGPTADASDRAMDPAAALSATNLFVRYDDKSGGTLERAAKGRVDEGAVETNLRLDYHTEFDAEGVTVEGRPFEAFLHDSTEYRFVEWLLTAPLFEIRRTDTRPELAKLYEALPAIDRIDLDGEVSVEREGGADTVAFDVVCRNKMGDPLFVADIDDARDPTEASTVTSLLDRSESVAESIDSLAAACNVTSSYFDAGAMEAAVDATRGGLFSRSSRRSYVKLSRKRGFHLCLIEARDDDFFLSVPDL